MTYQLLSKTEPVARKAYRCIWCNETIEPGSRHGYRAGKFYGDFQYDRWHLECMAAADRFFRETGEEDFMPGEFKRGTMEDK